MNNIYNLFLSTITICTFASVINSLFLKIHCFIVKEVFVNEITITETGSIRGSIEATSIENNGHIAGKISADIIIIGRSAVIKGDIFFKNTLKTEEGADIDGYIKRANNGKLNT